eukprot:7847657-Pyramimonas_sp.AAC.1
MGDGGGWNGPFPGVMNSRKGSNHRSSGKSRCSAREVGSDNTTLRTALSFVASLPAGRPAMTLGCVPTKKGMFQMTSAS